MLQIEKRGIPSVMISHTSYSPVQQYASEDNGLPLPRRVHLPALPYSKAYPAPANYQYLQERVVRPEVAKIVAALTEPLTESERNPNGVAKWQRDYNFYYNDGTAPNHDFPNGTYPSNRYPLSSTVSTTADSWNALVGDDQPDVISFTGASDRDVYEQFYDYAQEYLFGDGLPMVPPTREVVDEMLAATTRAPDEVIGGKFMMRKGVPTVEKVAINAVMAGAKPEYFPVILAAMEAYSQDLENRQMFFHGSTAGTAYTYLIAVSGAIAEEIGMNSEAGYFGSGNDANNTIGRAIRLCLRNIGHLWVPYIDTIRHGRYNDTTFYVLAENEDAIPAGWQTYREQMGFSKDQNIVTVTSTLQPVVNKWGMSGGMNYNENAVFNVGQPDAWTPQSIVDGFRLTPNRAATLPNIYTITPAQASAFAELGLDDVSLRKQNTGVPALPVGLGFNATDDNTPANWQRFVIVTGEDPGRANSFNSATHSNGVTWKSQLITGATLTQAGRDLAAPAAPKNFRVEPGENPGEAVLYWDAPDNAGRAPIVGYEVTAQDHDYERWVTVPGGAEAGSATLTHLDGGAPYTFRVRAVAGKYERGAEMFGFGGRRVPSVNGDPTGTGANATTTSVYTNIDTTVSWGPVAGRGAITSITWETPGARINPTTPGEVFWIMAAATDNHGEIKVSWHPPFSDGGSLITGWVYSTDNGATWAVMDEDNGTDLTYSATERFGSYIVTNQSDGNPLADGTEYNIVVRAVNAVGAGVFPGQTAAQGAGSAWPFAVPARTGRGLVPVTTKLQIDS